MDEHLSRRFLPPPKRGGALATTLPASPAAFPVVHLQVLRRKRMSLATYVRYAALNWQRVSEQLTGVAEAHDTS
jgi:hypothetical protein